MTLLIDKATLGEGNAHREFRIRWTYLREILFAMQNILEFGFRWVRPLVAAARPLIPVPAPRKCAYEEHANSSFPAFVERDDLLIRRVYFSSDYLSLARFVYLLLFLFILSMLLSATY